MNRNLAHMGYARVVFELINKWEDDPRVRGFPPPAAVVQAGNRLVKMLDEHPTDHVEDARAMLLAAQLLVAEADRVTVEQRGCEGDIICALDFWDAHELLDATGEEE